MISFHLNLKMPSLDLMISHLVCHNCNNLYFGRYLLGQNYDPSEITIISMYTGQLLLLKSKMPRSEFDGVKITSVDNFQGKQL